MSEAASIQEGTISLRDASGESGRDGVVSVELELDRQRVSSCRIVPLVLRVGAATVRMDGIGHVETLEEYRRQGLARRVLHMALGRMVDGDAALTMLYGIVEFYPKFGYATVGPECTLSLPPLEGDLTLPAGWSVRLFRRGDLPAVQRLYERATVDAVGAAVRPHEGYPWTRLLESADSDPPGDCRVVEDASGQVVAYAWRGEHLSFVRFHAGHNPDDLILAEVLAEGSAAADAILAVCRRWADEESARRGREVRQVMLFSAHDGSVAAAARHTEATFRQGYGPDGGWMARVLSAERLFRSLRPELSRRLQEARHPFSGRLRIVTDGGDVALLLSPDGLEVEGAPPGAQMEALAVHLPQTALARLAMGAFDPSDLLSRLEDPPHGAARELIEAMFPLRRPHVFLADRF